MDVADIDGELHPQRERGRSAPLAQAKRFLSFDDMAELYDETRMYNVDCLGRALDFVVENWPPARFKTVFEPGIGTGRIAVPFAQRGYRVVGIDVSKRMLGILRKRLTDSGDLSPILSLQCDARHLPFRDAAFDLGVAAHLFYFIEEWRSVADEMLRVIGPEGPIVLIHTGSGAEIPLVNERYKTLCGQMGCPIGQIGVSSTREVATYLESRGCRVRSVRDRGWAWTSRIQLGEALAYVKARAYSFTQLAPEAVHAEVTRRLQSELLHQFDGMATEVEVANEVYLVVASRSFTR